MEGVQRLVHKVCTYKCDEVHLGQRLVLISIVLKLERLRKQGLGYSAAGLGYSAAATPRDALL